MKIPMHRIDVSVSEQMLRVYAVPDDRLIRAYRIATAKNGVGEQRGSERTPRGLHVIRAKIGAGSPPNTVFVGRRPTGEVYTPALREQFPARDWILTRILWLSGCEVGKNRLGELDTMRRYVYIHGCPDTDAMGIPSSHGCIKMRNAEIIELYDLVEPYTQVLIRE